jgi:5-hydroxyisourate hydrolase
MARLTTHVLDTSRGAPAAGVAVELHLVESGGDSRRLIASAVTDADGRTPAPLLSGDRVDPGVYELTFKAAAYFAQAGTPLANPPFLGDVVVRFGIADARGHYHVPLLLSPYGYSTYRGS